jgi:predicted O-methyltransferase YrrM
MKSIDNIASIELENYCIDHSTAEHPVLYDLYRQTHLTQVSPRMSSGNIQGQFLQLLCKLFQPQNILEIGTYTGYAAIAMALALPEKSMLTTIEVNPELEDFIRNYIQKSNTTDKINLIIGDAMEFLKNNTQKWDFVFLDANKEHYIDYFNLLLPQMNQGGIIIADNVLWGCKVVLQQNSDKIDTDTLTLMRFNDYIQQCNQVENLLLPLRDGLMVIRKL